MGITHTKVATVPDNPNYEVGTSEWNDDHVVTAADIPVVDDDGYFDGTDVETVLAEIGAGGGGGGGAPTTADYLVGTTNGSLSAEIVVGTSPGGELGGTWASPTVDATHSGSTHAAAQAAAEATAASALSSHESDTTSVHGISDTSALATATDVSNAVSAHTGDTSDAHDASAVSLLDSGAHTAETDVEGAIAEIYTSIEAISDTDDQTAAEVPFTPAGTIAATDTQAAVEEVATDAASALSSHESDTTSIHGITNTANLYASGGTDVAVTDGGTGASSAPDARTNLGLVIGTDVAAQGDARFPSSGEKSALAGTSGTPGSGNKYVTDEDPRFVLSNIGASTAPTVGDDSDDGYAVGSRWIDTTADKEYVAVDVTVGAAVWKETTKLLPVVAVASVATGEATTSTSYADLATDGPSVTVTVPASGKVKVAVSSQMQNSTTDKFCGVGVALSGANTVAAATALISVGSFPQRFGVTKILTGLTPGSTTFKLRYIAEAGTATFTFREISVEPVD